MVHQTTSSIRKQQVTRSQKVYNLIQSFPHTNQISALYRSVCKREETTHLSVPGVAACLGTLPYLNCLAWLSIYMYTYTRKCTRLDHVHVHVHAQYHGTHCIGHMHQYMNTCRYYTCTCTARVLCLILHLHV